MATLRGDGDKIDYVPSSNVASGELVVIGSFVGMADHAIAANEVGSLRVRGLIRGTCATGATGAAGSVIKFDPGSGFLNASTGTNAGYLVKARVASDTTVDVLLWPGT